MTAMNAKQAAQLAKRYIADLFAEEEPDDVGLEEIEFDDVHQTWKVTVGFIRTPREDTESFRFFLPERLYKVVTLRDENGEAVSVRSRKTASQGCGAD